MKLRFFNDEAATGPWNMAKDEALGNSLGQNPSVPFLRIYRWNPPTLSFGYNQKLDGLINPTAAFKHGYGLVRRATGGRMVFHNLELTFSLGFSSKFLTNRAGNNFLQMFIAGLEPLVEALNLAGIPAEFATPERQRTSNSIHCYATAAGHSIYANGKKLIGAAALHRKSPRPRTQSPQPPRRGEPTCSPARTRTQSPQALRRGEPMCSPARSRTQSPQPPRRGEPMCSPARSRTQSSQSTQPPHTHPIADYMMIHGSIPIKSTFPSEEIFLRPIGSKILMAELSSYLNHNQISALPNLIATTYQKLFDLPLQPGHLTPTEKHHATQLTQTKYSTPL